MWRALWAVAMVLAPGPALAIGLTQPPAVSVTPHQVTVWWRTDVSGTTEVHFGPTSQAQGSAYPRHSVWAQPAGTVHSRTLCNLAPGTSFYRVQSTDLGSGQTAVSAEGSFTVPAPGAGVLDRYVLDGQAVALAAEGSTLYLGGSFTELGIRRGSGLGFDAAGAVSDDSPMFAGPVLTATSDGKGGFYVGGDFRFVGGLPRDRVAHLLPDLGVDPDWAPSVNSLVYDIEVSGSTVYLLGSFSSVGGSTRSGAAAVDAATGAVLPWRHLHQRQLDAAQPRRRGRRGDCGGERLGSQSRGAGSGPRAGRRRGLRRGELRQRERSDSAHRHRGCGPGDGRGDLVESKPRGGRAGGRGGGEHGLRRRQLPSRQPHRASNGGSGARRRHRCRHLLGPPPERQRLGTRPERRDSLPRWELFLSGCGDGAQPRRGDRPRHRRGAPVGPERLRLGVLAGRERRHRVPGRLLRLGQRRDGTDQRRLGRRGDRRGHPLEPAARVGGVRAGTEREHCLPRRGVHRHRRRRRQEPGSGGGWNLRSSAALGPEPRQLRLHAGAEPGGNTVYIGGDFTSVKGTALRSRAAAFDAVSGALEIWDPNPNDDVYALAVGDAGVHLGGQFTSANAGTPRSHAALVDATTGALLPWSPALSSTVYALGVSGGAVYVGNFFSPRVAAFDPATGAPLSWNPAPLDDSGAALGGAVLPLCGFGRVVFAGSYFSGAGSTPQSGMMSLGCAAESMSGTRLAFTTPPRVFSAGVCGGTAAVVGVQLQEAGGAAAGAPWWGLALLALARRRRPRRAEASLRAGARSC